MLSGPGGSARRLTGQSNGAGRALGDGCTAEKYSRRSQPPPMVCIVHINRGGVPRASTSLSTRSSRGHLQPPQKPNAAAEHAAQVRCHAGCPWALEVAARGARNLRLEPSPCNM